jgi:hypothetical protein
MRAMSEVRDQQEEVIPGKSPAFSHFIARFAGGQVNHELTEALDQVAVALNQHFQDFRGTPKGEIKLTLKFKLEKGSVAALADIAVKLPKAPESGAIFYIDAANHFSEDDPRQITMGFPRAAAGPRPVP